MHLMVFLLGVFLPALGVANNAVFNHPMTTQGQQQLDLLSKEMAQANVVRGDFKQLRIVKILKRPLKSSGSFIFSEKYGLMWRIQKPFVTNIMIRDGKLVQRAPGRDIQVIDASDNPSARIVADIFRAIFSQDKEILNRYFNQFFVATESGWSLGLIPKDQSLAQVMARVVVGGKDKINQIIIEERNGDKAKITLLDVRTTQDESTVSHEFISVP